MLQATEMINQILENLALIALSVKRKIKYYMVKKDCKSIGQDGYQ